uniref:Uncharacterized protein n=1 Tax=Tanacetum cinerariifolium TaxID=118510 RepID=A0A6L2JPM0_TANCI|nr:hypothetical protein [Tanacetum cinerariifolium]
MGYEKSSTKLTFYKAFFFAQWKFFIQTILQCMSAKTTAWNEFSSSMASAIICLATGRKFIFSKYNFDSMDASKQGEIAELDADEDVTLVDAEEYMNTDVQGRLAESQAKVYHLDLQHAEKVLNMQDTDEVEHAEVEEVIEVVTTAKLMTKVVTTTATTITAAQVPKASAPRRKRGVVIQDPEETPTASVIVHTEEDIIEQVKKREKQDNTVIRLTISPNVEVSFLLTFLIDQQLLVEVSLDCNGFKLFMLCDLDHEP